MMFGLTGCTNSTDFQQEQQTEQIMQQSQQQLGLPNIKNFYEKKTLKMIMEECDKSNLVTYVYLKNEMTGKLVYLGQGMGYGIPYGTEYTNPQRTVYQSVTLPQADPNGLFKDSGVNATWLMLIDQETGKARPIYCEPDLVVTPFKLHGGMLEQSSLPIGY
jgi:hypothetical protein